MLIGRRLRDLREYQKLSQGDVEKRTGLARCYISRVENGNASPSLETLEKFALALNIEVYQIFYEGDDKLPDTLEIGNGHQPDGCDWGSFGKDARYVNKLRNLLKCIHERDRQWLLFMAEKRVEQRRES